MIGRPLCPALAGVLLIATAGSAQQINRDEYFAHLPAMPPRVEQTAASVQFSLYGDITNPGYRDSLPLDGVDDARAHLLLKLAARFSPVLRRNNFSGPQDFRVSLGGLPVLHIDTWSMGRRIGSDSVLLFHPGAAVDPSLADLQGDAFRVADETTDCVRSDSVLQDLLREMDPDIGEARAVPAEAPEEKVLFFDFPGSDEASWRRAYQDQSASSIYAHVFINEDPGTRGEARYDFVIQYWFFYPFNDGPNNHEGDWEHLVVLVTTPERAQRGAAGGGRLEAGDVRRILAGGALADSLVIGAVEYYFHESVMTLDYLPARDATPLTRWQELKHVHIWQQPDFVANTLTRRLRAYGGRLANHPVAYIGGNSKGPDELLAVWPRFGGSYNRNAHGTYPFPGTWQGVGPLGSTEALAGELVPRLRAGIDTLDAAAPLQFADEHVLSYGEEQIRLMPDWERVQDLVLDSPEAARELSWLLLPIRWGYPAVASLGAGAIKHVDLGQVAPEGPMFQPTWNRLAASNGFHQYTPRVLRVMLVPVTPWDRIHNGWGVLNIPRMLLGFLPGWSVVLSELAPWLSVPLEAVGLNTGRTYAPEQRTHRFTSAGAGTHWQQGGAGFARLLPAPDDPRLLATTAGVDTRDIGLEANQLRRAPADGVRAWVDLHYGARFSVHNSYTRSTSRVSYTTAQGKGTLGVVQGDLDLQELLGGFRYGVRKIGGSAQLFAGAGWGWTWYQVDNVTCTGTFSCSDAVGYRRPGGYAVTLLPTRRWWPNTGYFTAGLEITAPRRAWMFDRVGYGLQLEYTGLLHRLGALRPYEGSLGPVTRRELSVGLVTSW